MKILAFSLMLCALLSFHGTPLTQAQRPDTPTFGQHGPYAVGTRELRLEDAERPLTITIWYPALNPDQAEENTVYTEGLVVASGSALRDAQPDPSGAPYPLVAFSHGSAGIRFQSLFFTERLASYGFVVIAADHPGNTVLDAFLGTMDAESILLNFALRPLDVLRLIDYAAALNEAGSAFDGLIDMERVAVAGHSFGGYTALSVGGAQLDFTALNTACAAGNESDLGCMVLENADHIAQLRGLGAAPQGLWPATHDPRVKAVVAMAPASGHVFGETGINGITAPTLVLVGTNDTVTNAEANAYPVYEGLQVETKALVALENAGHYVFVVECSRFPQNLVNLGFYERCSDSVWDMQRAHDLINHFTIAFLLHTLKDDPAALEALQTETTFPAVRYEAQIP